MKRAWAAAGLLLSSCVPWTVRPIAKSSDDAVAGQRSFDASAYVASIWDSKVLPAVDSQSADLAGLLRAAANLPPAFLVKGTARVLAVDTASRAGVLRIDLVPCDGRADAVIQICPVLRGTALRDALPFIQFSQFVNQLEFARVGNALNDRALRAALAAIEPKKLAGKTIEFAGAAARPTANEPPEIVPVRLGIVGDAR